MQSEEGQALAALREIRVAATPDWNASSIVKQSESANPGK
jgi:hypothetical protein